jgi:hypothetical protein
VSKKVMIAFDCSHFLMGRGEGSKVGQLSDVNKTRKHVYYRYKVAARWQRSRRPPGPYKTLYTSTVYIIRRFTTS